MRILSQEELAFGLEQGKKYTIHDKTGNVFTACTFVDYEFDAKYSDFIWVGAHFNSLRYVGKLYYHIQEFTTGALPNYLNEGWYYSVED
jgi:hypothetical protein